MITGYITGLSCLFLITYRTIIAFLSNSKAITIHINKFGEQYLDLVAIVIFWTICTIGFIMLLKNIKDGKNTKKTNLNYEASPLIKPAYSSYYMSNTPKISNKEDIEYKTEFTDRVNE